MSSVLWWIVRDSYLLIVFVSINRSMRVCVCVCKDG